MYFFSNCQYTLRSHDKKVEFIWHGLKRFIHQLNMTTSDNIRMALVICGYDGLQHAQLGRTFYALTAPLCQRDFWETGDMLRVKKAPVIHSHQKS